MNSWIGWLLPVLLAVAFVVTLVMNQRRVRRQRLGTVGRRAVPTGLVAGYALLSAVTWLGAATLLAVVVLVVQGKGFTGTWWTFALTAVLLTIGGALGRHRVAAELRRARSPFD